MVMLAGALAIIKLPVAQYMTLLHHRPLK
ncbi:MAG: hypothetical protein ACR5LD_00415 [Symbiopectobacterium sp.]